MHWLKFFISAALIIFSGVRLTKYADHLSDRLQLGKVWVGVILLGAVTSLPEALTSVIAVVFFQAPDLALGNILGSNAFNPLLIIILDILHRQDSVTNTIVVNASHRSSAWCAIGLSLIVLIEILMGTQGIIVHVGPISLSTILILAVYLGGMRRLRFLSQTSERPLAQVSYLTKSISHIWINLLFSGILIVIGAVGLTHAAEVIASQTGLGQTFVGSLFLAFVTSLPEVVVSFSAFRLGSLDLAIGNIFGSNMTNIVIVAICSLFHRGGPLLKTVSPTHILTAMLGIVLTGMVLVGIQSKAKKTWFGLGWDSWVMLLLFTNGMTLLYMLR